MPKYGSETAPDSDNSVSPLPIKTEEIEQLVDLLRRIVV
jgi:hypothetical protein